MRPDPFPAAVIARGATADILDGGDDRVVKLFHASVPPADVDQEERAARAACAIARSLPGLHVPEVLGRVEREGRQGIVFQRVVGTPLVERLLAGAQSMPSTLAAAADLLARTQVTWHKATSGVCPDDLPVQRVRLAAQIANASALPVSAREALRAELDALADGPPCLCHGDLHPSNLLIDARGEVWIIDWHDATRGTAAADVARTSWLLLNAAPHAHPAFDTAAYAELRDRFHRRYLATYQAAHPAAGLPQRLAAWTRVVAAGRLSENIAPEEADRIMEMLGDIGTTAQRM